MADRPAVGHVAHDELLIAAWVSGDTEPEDAARAADLASRCDACRDLATDLRGLRAGMRALPPATRTRDFRLTPADAERLRSRPRWLGRIGTVGGAAFTRPLAGAMTALGLAGLLLTTVPLGGPGAGATDRDAARVEAQDAGSAGGQAAPIDDASAAAAPAATPEGAEPSERPMPVAASSGEEAAASPVPGDATAAGAGGRDESDLHATPRAVAQATAVPSAPVDDTALRSAPPTAPTTADLTRPVVAVASSALLAGGLLLLLVTRRGVRRP